MDFAAPGDQNRRKLAAKPERQLSVERMLDDPRNRHGKALSAPTPPQPANPPRQMPVGQRHIEVDPRLAVTRPFHQPAQAAQAFDDQDRQLTLLQRGLSADLGAALGYV